MLSLLKDTIQAVARRVSGVYPEAPDLEHAVLEMKPGTTQITLVDPGYSESPRRGVPSVRLVLTSVDYRLNSPTVAVFEGLEVLVRATESYRDYDERTNPRWQG